MSGNSTALNLYLLVATALLVAAFFWFVPAIPQDPAYHDFADTRSILGVRNFWNVVSNAPFIIVGAWGLLQLEHTQSTVRVFVRIYSIGLLLICCGSAWYHLAPDNASLAWDRLAMTVSFMTVVAFVLSRLTGAQSAMKLLWPLLAVGLFSVLYWDATEQSGVGDLRFYAVVQFLPGILIVALLLLAPGHFRQAMRIWLWSGLAVYVLAKLAEWQDVNLYALGQAISGHSLKHILAALSSYYFLRAILTVVEDD